MLNIRWILSEPHISCLLELKQNCCCSVGKYYNKHLCLLESATPPCQGTFLMFANFSHDLARVELPTAIKYSFSASDCKTLATVNYISSVAIVLTVELYVNRYMCVRRYPCDLSQGYRDFQKYTTSDQVLHAMHIM